MYFLFRTTSVASGLQTVTDVIKDGEGYRDDARVIVVEDRRCHPTI